MIIRKQINKDYDHRMEGGPISNECYEYVKCDRCGKKQSELPDMCTDEFDFIFEKMLWYCNYFKTEFGKYNFESPYDERRVDYCPECIKTDEERQVVLHSMYYTLKKFYLPAGFSIGRQLENIIKHQATFEKLCLKYINALNTFKPSLANISFMEKQIKQALNRSIVKFPTYQKLQSTQMTLYN